MSSRTILVTGCGGPLGVNVTRSLRLAPEPLRVIGTDANRYHLHLSLADRSVLVPPARELEPYLGALERLIVEERVDLLLPTHPVEVRAISTHRARLTSAGARVFLPEASAIASADDKWLTYQRLAAAGVAVPLTHLISGQEDLRRCFEEIPDRPIWVRGRGAPGIGIGVASLPCRELEHAIAWVDHHRGWGGFIASEYLPGRNLTWCGLFNRGSLVATQSRERLEYVLPHVSPSGVTGAPAVSRTVRREDVARSGEAAVRALSAAPHGVFFVDLKENAAGVPRVTEVNAGRFGTTIHFYSEAGCNFPYLLVRLALGETIDGAPLIEPIPPGVYWIRTLDCGPALVRGLDPS